MSASMSPAMTTSSATSSSTTNPRTSSPSSESRLPTYPAAAHTHISHGKTVPAPAGTYSALVTEQPVAAPTMSFSNSSLDGREAGKEGGPTVPRGDASRMRGGCIPCPDGGCCYIIPIPCCCC
ncbi:hypothetical protein C8R43DRAFT_1001514 [Mycena crocata]|nr:hypothetical protein C8R43DRAFT_1001514 [Mycena crocata]